MEGYAELQVNAQEEIEANLIDEEERSLIRASESSLPQSKNYKNWIRLCIYSFFVLSCQAIATLLGRLYYDNGGKSKSMATLVQLIGFPILWLYSFFSCIRQPETTDINVKPASSIIIGCIYVSLGLLAAANCYLSSVGLLFLPVSTYSLIWASQLAFNAFFSYLLNSLKLTPAVMNSLFLLTASCTLLAFNNQSENTAEVSQGEYATGFLCSIIASAGSGMQLSLVQLVFRKILKKQTFSSVTDMVIYQSLVASCAILVGLFASGEWRSLTNEMKNYKLGEVSYVMNLVCTAISWQVYTIGVMGLVFESSSVFSNAVTALGLPVVPVLAVIVFHDQMDGLKIIALALAIWGFISYVYQHYLDAKRSTFVHMEFS